MDTPTTRETLIRRYRDRHDLLAWDEFYRTYEPLVRTYVRRMVRRDPDVDDLVQDVFLKLRAQIDRFELDHAKGRFRAWLRTVVDNGVRDWFRRQRDKPGALPAEAPPPPHGGGADVEWRRAVFEVVMGQVREEFKDREKTLACFERATVQSRPAKEVAAELGIDKVNNVYVYAHRVLKRVRELCDEYDEELDDAPTA